MKTGITRGIAVLALAAGATIPTVSAAHGHHHGQIIDRVLHKQHASSGSSSTINGTDASNDIDQTVGVECVNEACDLLTVIANSPPSLHARSTVSQTHTTAVQLKQTESTAKPTRRRTVTRTTEVTVYEEPTETSNFYEAVPTEIIDDDQHGPTHLSANILGDEAKPRHGSRLELRAAKLKPRVLKPRQDGSYQSFVLGGFEEPSSTISAAKTEPTAICPEGNGTSYQSSSNIAYQVVCNINFDGNDYAFQKVNDFEECVLRCDTFNWESHGVNCIAALFVPSRLSHADNCYLKSSVSNPSPSIGDIQGAIRLSVIKGYTSSASDEPTSAPGPLPNSATAAPEPDSTATATPDPEEPSTPSTGSGPGVTYAKGDSVIVPKVASSKLHGPSKNVPSKQYIEYEAPKGITLGKNLLVTGVNGKLSTNYKISAQTGVLPLNSQTQSLLAPLAGPPHLSRDGGQGGYINGYHLFIFCDTGSYTAASASTDGKFLGFVSSSVAVDTGMNGLKGEALNLQDGIGQWSDDAGRMRGFAPLTEGEQAYNLAKQGGGQRYAIWPDGPIIPLDATSGIMYAPIIYDNVNRQTKEAIFTYTGATLLKITVDNKAGPQAQRIVSKIFDQGDIEWGCGGGIRAWGPSGIGGTDGYVYIFGTVPGGSLIGRTTPDNVAERDSFEYWNGKSWTNDVPDTSSKAYFLEGRYIDLNVFYSPRHLTFIVVYLSAYADSVFYYRYLLADQGILPEFAPGGEKGTDYVENILKHEWSEQQVLYKAAKGKNGKYIYAGAVHYGYYGSNDITNGGSKMLLSWTAPTGENPASVDSEYQIVTAEVSWA